MGEQVRAILAWAKEHEGTFTVAPDVRPAGGWRASVRCAAKRMVEQAAPSPEEAIAKLAVMVGAG